MSNMDKSVYASDDSEILYARLTPKGRMLGLLLEIGIEYDEALKMLNTIAPVLEETEKETVRVARDYLKAQFDKELRKNSIISAFLGTVFTYIFLKVSGL